MKDVSIATSNITYGVVLEGGGAKGAYQIGAWKALKELNIKIKGVVGTSVGALNGAMMVQNDYDKALAVWENMSFETITTADKSTIERLQNFDWRPWEIIKNRTYFKQALKSNGIDINPLKKLIQENINEKKIRESSIDYGLTTLRITKLKALELFIKDIKPGRLNDFILASAYLPVFKKEKLHGNYYLDGGFHNIVPVNMLTDKGYKNIIVIRLFGRGIEKRVNLKGVNIITIAPNDDLGGPLEFKKESCQQNIQRGYYDTLRVFKGYDGEKYYIQCQYNEMHFLEKFTEVSQKGQQRIIELFNIKSNQVFRTMFQVILPRVARILKLDKEWNYQTLMIAILENIAEKQQIEKFKIWNYDDFIKEIKQNILQNHSKNNKIYYNKNKFTCLISELILLI